MITLFEIEYEKIDSEITVFKHAAFKGTYTNKGKTAGFKIYDEDRNGFRNIAYERIITIKAASR